MAGAAAVWAQTPGEAEGPETPAKRIAKGEELAEEVCLRCHAPEIAQNEHRDREQWRELILPMVYGGVEDEDIELILDFLADRYGLVAEE